MAPRRALVVLAICVASLVPAQAAASPLELDRARAEALAGAGHDADDPGDLFAAASVFERRLVDPERAIGLYREVIALEPDGALAARARRRLSLLTPLFEGDPDALATWLEIVRGEASEPAATSIARAEALLEAYPDWPGAAHVELWLGDEARGVGDLSRARLHYQRALASSPSAELLRNIHRSRVQLGLSGGDAAEAEAALADLRRAGELSLSDRLLRDRVDIERGRARWLLVASIVGPAALLVLLASLAVGVRSLRAAAAALWRPPTEVIYLVPPLVLFVGLALVRFREVAASVAAMSAAGVVFTWLSGAGLRKHPPSRLRVVVHILATCAGVGAAVYLALHQGGLLDDLLDTLDIGPS